MQVFSSLIWESDVQGNKRQYKMVNTVDSQVGKRETFHLTPY